MNLRIHRFTNVICELKFVNWGEAKMTVTKSHPRRVAAALVFCVCVAAIWLPVSAQRDEQAGGGVSSDRLARIGQMIDRRIAAGDVPGTVTLVAQNGRIVHFEARGVMDIETKRPLAKDAIFSLASL